MTRSDRPSRADQLLTVEAAAERMSTSVRFVRRLIAERRIAFVKLGRHVRITETDITEFIEAGRVAAHERSSFNKMSAWPYAVKSICAEGLHVHDLRHTGNTFAASGGAALKDLMARMGHDSERAALIYQHEARGADKMITNAIDAHVQAEQSKDDDDGSAGVLIPAG